ILKDSYILSPTMPIKAPKIKDVEKLTPVQNYMLDILTIPPNLCGFPHISFPYDYIDGLPIGAQVITDHFNDKALFSFVEDWENNFTYKFKYNLGEI
ncbi:MAG: amidase family protein, partial [Nanoarchaeota archaeon]|nr:amidase family protein [Nanoarchaeota archaeon]